MAGQVHPRTRRVNTTTTSGERAVPRGPTKDMTRILGDCRDLAIQRLVATFKSMLDRVGELLMARAERSDVRDALQHECTVLCDVLRADGGAIAAGNDPPKLPDDPPVAVRDVAVEAVVAWGGKGPGAAALGALWAWEWMRLVHVALVRAKPGVASLAAC